MEGSKRNIPVKMGDFSIIDTEFSSIRERFDAEMRKMEDEMNKFRSELISREMPSPLGQSSITSRWADGGPVCGWIQTCHQVGPCAGVCWYGRRGRRPLECV